MPFSSPEAPEQGDGVSGVDSAALTFLGQLSAALGLSETPFSLRQRLCGTAVGHAWPRWHGIQIRAFPAAAARRWAGAKEPRSISAGAPEGQRMVAVVAVTSMVTFPSLRVSHSPARLMSRHGITSLARLVTGWEMGHGPLGLVFGEVTWSKL